MQVTIDIPEPLFRKLEDRATRQQRPVEDVVLGEVMRAETDEEFRERMKDRYPLIRSAHPNSMIIPEGGFNDALFGDDESA